MAQSSLVKTPADSRKNTFHSTFEAELIEHTIEEGRQEVLLTADALVKGLVSEPVEIDWNEFKKFVRTSCNERTAVERVRYAKRFHYIVTTPEGPGRIKTDLFQLSESNRQDVMKGLAALTKYMGVYEEWKRLQKQFGLKWTAFSPESEAAYFEETFYNDSASFTNMLDWIKKVRTQIPADVAAVLDYTTLTGLRAEEAIFSIQKLQDPESRKKYVNNDKMTLEHFQYPDLFIRRTKKAYVSIITDDILRLAEQARGATCYRTVQYHLNSRKLGVHLKYCRKVFGTYLRMNGIEEEFIDIIQGRKAKTVFAKHYFRPDWKQRTDMIRQLLDQLYQEIIGKTNKCNLQPAPAQDDVVPALSSNNDLNAAVHAENRILWAIVPLQLENSKLSLKAGYLHREFADAIRLGDTKKAEVLEKQVREVTIRLEENTKVLEQLTEQQLKLKGLTLADELAKLRASRHAYSCNQVQHTSNLRVLATREIDSLEGNPQD